MTTAAAEPVVVHLATHPLILALPAVIPAFLVVGVVVAIAIADRRRGDDEDEDAPADEVRSEADAPAADGPDVTTTPADPGAPPNRNEDDDGDRKAD